MGHRYSWNKFQRKVSGTRYQTRCVKSGDKVFVPIISYREGN